MRATPAALARTLAGYLPYVSWLSPLSRRASMRGWPRSRTRSRWWSAAITTRDMRSSRARAQRTRRPRARWSSRCAGDRAGGRTPSPALTPTLALAPTPTPTLTPTPTPTPTLTLALARTRARTQARARTRCGGGRLGWRSCPSSGGPAARTQARVRVRGRGRSRVRVRVRLTLTLTFERRPRGKNAG